MQKYIKVMNTSKIAKMKTLFQIVLIHIFLILYVIDTDLIMQNNYIGNSVYALMLICVIFTLSTGIHYVFINLKLINDK